MKPIIFAKDYKLKQIVEDEIRKYGLNADLNHIDVSQVTDMSLLFCHSEFNGDISQWNVSNVKNMTGMFYNSHFNGNISQWNMKNLKNSSHMFAHSQFNQDISCHRLDHLFSSEEMFSINQVFNFNNLLLINKIKNKSALKSCFYFPHDFNLKTDSLLLERFIHFVQDNNIPIYNKTDNFFFVDIFFSNYPFLICNAFSILEEDKDNFSMLKTLFSTPLIDTHLEFFDNLDLYLFLLIRNKYFNFKIHSFEEKTITNLLSNLSKSLNHFEELIKFLNQSKEKCVLFSQLTQLFFDFECELIKEKNEEYFNYLKENDKLFSDFYPYYSKKQKNELLKLKNIIIENLKSIDLLL